MLFTANLHEVGSFCLTRRNALERVRNSRLFDTIAAAFCLSWQTNVAFVTFLDISQVLPDFLHFALQTTASNDPISNLSERILFTYSEGGRLKAMVRTRQFFHRPDRRVMDERRRWTWMKFARTQDEYTFRQNSSSDGHFSSQKPSSRRG